MKPLRNGRKVNKGMCGKQRPVLEPNAAGIDVGASEMFVAVSPDRDGEPVRVFDTFTSDLEALVGWLKSCGVTTVALESTGVYWIPLYQMLEQAGRLAAVPGQCATSEKRAGPQNGLARLPVVAISPFGWTTTSRLPASGLGLRRSIDLAASCGNGGGFRPACAAHAEGDDSNESATAQRHQRYHWCHWVGDY